MSLPPDFDESLRCAHEAGAYDEVARRFLAQHGPNIFAFLCDRFVEREEACDAFARFAEDFWRGLPSFQWRASLRSWAFALARHAAFQHSRALRRARCDTLPPDSVLAVIASVRSETEPFRRSEIQSRLRALRKTLSEEDQTLIVLRVDQRLSWTELSVVLSGSLTSEAERARDTVRLRQRFQRVKQRLRTLAEAEGLLPRRPTSEGPA